MSHSRLCKNLLDPKFVEILTKVLKQGRRNLCIARKNFPIPSSHSNSYLMAEIQLVVVWL